PAVPSHQERMTDERQTEHSAGPQFLQYQRFGGLGPPPERLLGHEPVRDQQRAGRRAPDPRRPAVYLADPLHRPRRDLDLDDAAVLEPDDHARAGDRAPAGPRA